MNMHRNLWLAGVLVPPPHPGPHRKRQLCLSILKPLFSPLLQNSRLDRVTHCGQWTLANKRVCGGLAHSSCPVGKLHLGAQIPSYRKCYLARERSHVEWPWWMRHDKEKEATWKKTEVLQPSF